MPEESKSFAAVSLADQIFTLLSIAPEAIFFGALNSRNKEYQSWRLENYPIELYSPKFTVQKIRYIHENPVRAGIVERAEDFLTTVREI